MPRKAANNRPTPEQWFALGEALDRLDEMQSAYRKLLHLEFQEGADQDQRQMEFATLKLKIHEMLWEIQELEWVIMGYLPSEVEVKSFRTAREPMIKTLEGLTGRPLFTLEFNSPAFNF